MRLRLLLPLFLIACGADLDGTTRSGGPAGEPPRPSQAPSRARPVPTLRPQPVEQPLPEPQPGEVVRVLRDQTTTIALALTPQTVFCSAVGYSASFLKVSVPDLDWLAHFDHRVEETGLPCAAAGPCSETVTPEALLSANPRLALVPVRVVLSEHLKLDPDERTCTRRLVEKVTIELTDRVLRHSVEGEPAAWPYDACAALAARG